MIRNVLLVACLTLISSACTPSVKEPLHRTLPPSSAVIPAPVPLPGPRADRDAVAGLAENREAAAENARRLGTARRNYEALRREIGGAGTE
jgi:hypothetical protein